MATPELITTPASVFADDEDKRRYDEAIARGASEKAALKVGDNQQGAWNDYTGPGSGPIVALPPGMPGVYHNRLVQLVGPKGTTVARIGDKAPANGRIDLNPDAAAAIGHPGGVTPIQWSFLDGTATPPPNVSLGNSNRISLSSIPAIAPPDISLGDEGDPLSIPAIGTADNASLDGTPAYLEGGDGQTMSTDNATVNDTPDENAAGMKLIPRPPLPPPGQARFNQHDGSIEWDDGHGGTIRVPGPKSTKAFYYPAKAEKSPRTSIQTVTDQETGQTKSQLLNMENGEVIKELPNPTSRGNAQAETLRLRMLNAAKTQPAIIGYINVKNNYDSLAQNAAIPPEQRTPQDDMAAINAFGAIEHPGTGVTDDDKKMVTGGMGWRDYVGLKWGNFVDNKANMLTPKAVAGMRDAAKRALDSRQNVYNEQLAPFLQEAKRLGMDPSQVNGALGGGQFMSAPSPTPAAAPATPIPPSTDQVAAEIQRIRTDPNASEEDKAQADRAEKILNAPR